MRSQSKEWMVLPISIKTFYKLDATHKEILDWISPYDFETKHRAVKAKRVANSGKWFLNRPEFQNWARGISTGMLFCPGLGNTHFLNLEHTDHCFNSWRRKNFYYVLSSQIFH